jgi:transmembrane sensor
MARPLNELEALGEHVADTLRRDSARRERAIETARRGFVGDNRVRRGSQAPRALAFAAVMALAGAAALFVLLRAPQPLRFDVDGTSGTERAWLAAPATRPSRLTFSDGSELFVEPSARVRVVGTSADGAEIAIESGALRAQVTHTGHSSWRVNAGPFSVRVTGTRFALDWSPSSQVISLAVSEGSVIVSGSVVGNAWPLRAGEKLVASVPQGRVEVSKPETPVVSAPIVAPAASAASTASSAPHVSAVPPDTSARLKPDAEWREVAKSGDLKKAYAVAELSGFKGACASANAAELLLLGDAARLAGRADRAREALLALRQRFPRDSRRAAAAFALGKVAFDGRGAYGEAAEWFATSIREAPGGPLAREAAGRRLEALRHTGDQAGARAAATDYLARYPDGPHAPVARTILR